MSLPVVLASASPRRSELLSLLIPAFTIQPSNLEERLPEGMNPYDGAVHLARQKLMDTAGHISGPCRIIAADTLVVCEGKVLGKPKDSQDARCMLHLLSGKRHDVVTGLCVADRPEGRFEQACEITHVRFLAIPEIALEAYIATDEPYDKAGGYGIQGWAARYIDRIEGCFYNVMGLPIARLGKIMENMDM